MSHEETLRPLGHEFIMVLWIIVREGPMPLSGLKGKAPDLGMVAYWEHLTEGISLTLIS